MGLLFATRMEYKGKEKKLSQSLSHEDIGYLIALITAEPFILSSVVL